MPFITVIVTVHNSENFITQSLDSLRAQTFTDFEVICIDSSNRDSSPEILQKYACQDTRFRVITDSNGSYGHKINVGIQMAQGDYIAVLESDDAFEVDMLKSLAEIARVTNADYVNGQYLDMYSTSDGDFTIPHKMYKGEPYNCVLVSKESLPGYELMDRFWTGIIRRDFILKNHIQLNESPGASYQDLSFRFLITVLAQSCYHIDKAVYRYRMDNPESSMKDNTKVLTIAEEFDYLYQELVKRFDKNAWVWKLYYYWKYNDFHYNMFRLPKRERMILFLRYQQELEADWDKIPKEIRESHPYIFMDILEDPEEFLLEIETAHKGLCDHNQFIIEFLKKNKEQVVLFGTGALGKWLFDSFLSGISESIVCAIDNKEELWNTKLKNNRGQRIDIVSPQYAVEHFQNALFLIANRCHSHEMEEQLLTFGIRREQVIVYR